MLLVRVLAVIVVFVLGCHVTARAGFDAAIPVPIYRMTDCNASFSVPYAFCIDATGSGGALAIWFWDGDSVEAVGSGAGGGATPTWNAVMAQGNYYTSADSLATAACVCDNDGADCTGRPRSCTFVSAGNAVIIAYDTSDNPVSSAWTVYANSHMSILRDGQSAMARFRHDADIFDVLTLTTNVSGSVDVADNGVIRLANAEKQCWERNTTGTDKCLTVNSSNLLVYGDAASEVEVPTISSTSTLTGKTYDAEGAGNVLTTVSKIFLPLANCLEGVASLAWSNSAGGAAAPTAACNDTGNIQRPSADYSGSALNALETTFKLPADWTGNIDVTVRYASVAASPTGNVEVEISTVCRAAGETWEAAYNSVQTITDAVAAQNVLNDATQTSITTTGCAAGEDMSLKIGRDGLNDSNNDLAKFFYAEVTLRRAQ